MKIKINFKGKGTNLDVRKVSEWGKISGLMFHTKETDNLLFDFNSKRKISIHSWFVFFDFLAVWLDERNRVMEVKIVRPFTTVIRPRKAFRKLVELPFNNKNKEIIEFLVGEKRFK